MGEMASIAGKRPKRWMTLNKTRHSLRGTKASRIDRIAGRAGVFSVLTLALALAVTAAEGFAAQDERCFGKPATVTGAGTIVGTEGHDVIVGSESADLIDGKGGDDRICGLGGDDEIGAGVGDDRVDSGEGSDILIGDVNNPGLPASGGGDDWLYGGPGNDRFAGDSRGIPAFGDGNDHLFGEEGIDLMAGDNRGGGVQPGDAFGAGDDVIDGGSGPDGLIVGDNNANARR